MSSEVTINRKLAAEVVGTFVFVLVGAGSALATPSFADPASALVVAALANGLGLAMAVSATMAISGGVLNPAVALGLLAGGKLPYRDALPYIIAELAGATAAGIALVLAFPSSLGSAVHWGAPTLSRITVWQGTGVEAPLTFVLVIAVYGTAIDSRAPRIGGLGIRIAVLADILVGGPFTGAAMNPARAYGPMIAGGFLPSYWYIYLVGPIVGGIAGGLVYRYLLEMKQ